MRSGLLVASLFLAFAAGCVQPPPAPLEQALSVPEIPATAEWRMGEGGMTMGWFEGLPPFSASFSLNANVRGPFVWALDVDGDRQPDYNGTSLPADINHVYTHGGDMKVMFALATRAGNASHAAEIQVPSQVTLHGRGASGTSECRTTSYMTAAGEPRYQVRIGGFDPSDPTRSMGPPWGSTFELEDAHGVWSEAPMEGRQPAGTQAFRLCGPAWWPEDFSFAVTFVLD